jgi:multidrug efflux pump subunit AcrA (membrane-fusion protein)
VTAADIATDQSTVDEQRASVATARADLRQATLVAPIAGKVTAVTISKGDAVSGSSSADSPAIEIRGSRQDRTTVDVSDTQVRTLRVGMTASVTADGASTPVSGTVVSVGATGTESDSGSVTYPVTINIAKNAPALVSGADAAVSIAIAHSPQGIAVPTSAVHRSGTTFSVELMSSGKPVRHPVKIGAIGAALTQITSGLAAGQRVELADLGAAVPSSSNDLSSLNGRTRTFTFGGTAGNGGGRFGGTGGAGGAAPSFGAN